MADSSQYIIERKPIRHARINVNEQQQVKLIIPDHFSEEEIDRLISQKSKWIDQQLAHFKNEEQLYIDIPKGSILFLGKPHPKPDTDLYKWYRKQAKKYINNRVLELSEIHNIGFNKIYIRDSKTKWGNCSKQNNLSFNWRLVKAPPQVIDYVILHELCHTIILKHTQAFWLKLSTVCPEYNERADWLRKYGKSLFN